ncbi:PREDICTED: filament-like plant protein 7 [Tarenaya hassleriana]|uniref:filament-like plant protein 7 n=1 Tax=Tarenaya hassleriana TaxID=28532 RepID=UPI00053C1D1E|nr:PREDICTED: filament-like plant protein 7 [Tarenaya hassleriana]XP_010531252.1 PREDICTED: filament-like plant protein 7 [Tarenaya hassleriana]XP_019057396.1 PREDICTED: filament-like plant protein 7 [Tarenaya hassleriana]
MDQKAWPWKKKSAEKTIAESDKSNSISSKGNVEEIEKLVADKTDLEKNLKTLTDKLMSVMAECTAKDVLIKKQENEAQETLAGWEKAKAEAASLRRKLDDALNDKKKSEERTSHLDAGLKECMLQLRSVREEQQRTMHDVLAKNKLVEDLNRERDRVLADLNALTSRLESKEKENTSLKYEVRVLEKELEIRNEEREFSRRTAEASHKLHLENVKKITKLETECQRLRILVRKRLPGPAALSKMRSEVEMSGRDSLETRRRFNGSPIDSERINNLTEQLCLMEEENRTLREALSKKINELQFSRNVYSRTACRLLEFESRLEESSKGTNTEPGRSSNASHDVSLASVSEFDSDDKVSCADSMASALLSELENLKSKKQKGSSILRKSPEASEMKLMDDFAEMEKLAMVVSVDNPPTRTFDSTLPRWLQTVLEHKHVSRRNTDEILEDIRKALNHLGSDTNAATRTEMESQVSSQQTASSIVEEKPSEETGKDASFGGKCHQDLHNDLSKSISKVIKIIEGVSLDSPAPEISESQPGYTVRVLQWKTSELRLLLQRFLHTCHDLLSRKADINSFAEELSSALDWIVNHCFSLQDVSSMREEIKKKFDWDGSESESEAEVGTFSRVSEAVKHEDSTEKDLKGIADHKLQESDKSIKNLQKELETLRNSMAEIEGGAENYRTVADFKAANTKPQHLMDDMSAPDSLSEKEVPSDELKVDGKQAIRTEREIIAASERLAECQETILNLGKQLRALSDSKEVAPLSDQVVSEPTSLSTSSQPPRETKPEKRLINQRSSLKDQMKADDDADTEQSKGQKYPVDKNGTFVYNETIEALEHILLPDKGKGSERSSYAIVPQKKGGGVKSLWKKLLWRKKKSNSKKLPVPLPPT